MDETGQAVPKWLQDLLLGYGDPRAAHYKVLLKNERWKCSLSDGAKNAFDMDKNHLKLIIKNLKTVIEELEAEVYSDPTAYVNGDSKTITYADQEEM